MVESHNFMDMHELVQEMSHTLNRGLRNSLPCDALFFEAAMKTIS